MATWPKTCFFASATNRLPGPDDHVHRLEALDAVGQRRDRLRTADAVDLGDAEFVAGREHVAVVRAGGLRRHADDDLLDTRRLRRADGHQQRGGVRRRAAGTVHADALERPVAQVQFVLRRDAHLRVAVQQPGLELQRRCTGPAG